MESTLYRGVRGPNGVSVWKERDGIRANVFERFDLRNHSPTGFEWGYNGSGPAQLALALLADALGDDQTALLHYQRFKRQIVCRFDELGWCLSAAHVWDWFQGRCNENGAYTPDEFDPEETIDLAEAMGEGVDHDPPA